MLSSNKTRTPLPPYNPIKYPTVSRNPSSNPTLGSHPSTALAFVISGRLFFGSSSGHSQQAANGRIINLMELAIAIQIEKLPEGVYLATSDELQGLVAQGRTVSETLEIARDVARKLIEARRERDEPENLPPAEGRTGYTIVVAA
jgi:predicted RNase H-like HicB family nuclease